VEPNNFGMEPLIILYFQRDSSANNAILRVAEECGLTPREGEVLTGLSKGLTSKEIAQQLGISPNTVKTYLRLIMVKMGVTTRAAIVGRLLNHESTTNTEV
jgi:DNA-binding CsgD family transcriptional regulator